MYANPISLRRATHQSQRKNVKLLSFYPHRFSILPKGDEYDIDKVVDVSLRKKLPHMHTQQVILSIQYSLCIAVIRYTLRNYISYKFIRLDAFYISFSR